MTQELLSPAGGTFMVPGLGMTSVTFVISDTTPTKSKVFIPVAFFFFFGCFR